MNVRRAAVRSGVNTAFHGAGRLQGGLTAGCGKFVMDREVGAAGSDSTRR